MLRIATTEVGPSGRRPVAPFAVVAAIAASIIAAFALALSIDRAQAHAQTCVVFASSGFKVCHGKINPTHWGMVHVTTNYPGRRPIRFGTYNSTISQWQGGPWFRSSPGYHYAHKQPGWNWNGYIRLQVDNMGYDNPGFYLVNQH